MGSSVAPYFILTAEKVTNPKDLNDLKDQPKLAFHPQPPPVTPTPSGVSDPLKKGLVKYKIPVREIKRKETLSRKMEVIKEKLEKSRERFNERKRLQGDFKCEPTIIGLNENGNLPTKLERSTTDLDQFSKLGKKKANGSFPYVYFVVSEDKIPEENEGVVLDTGERLKSKSADKRRRVRIVEENRLKRERKEKQNQAAKMKSLARELGLKSSIESKPLDSRPVTRGPSVNHLVFPGTANDPFHGPSTVPNVHAIHSPPGIPPGTPATSLHYDNGRTGNNASDADESVPRKPFLSGPLYSGKAKTHTTSVPTIELPEITPDQRRRALGLGSMRFDELANAFKPPSSSEARNKRVTFAESLPVIKGSGFVISPADARNALAGLTMPTLGGRSVTMGSITLPSEQLDKQAMCQRFLAGENLSTARSSRRNGVPLPLPKIDIVSNVYDEMIIKMIQEYLQDSNTPTRQSQLAKELLLHLQKHSESMNEMNVPTSKKSKDTSLRQKMEKAEMAKHQMKTQKALQNSSLQAPPNTAEEISPKTVKSLHHERNPPTLPGTVEESENIQDSPNADNQRSVPFVQITFRNKSGEDGVKNGNDDDPATDMQLPKTPDTGSPEGSKTRERPLLSAVTPVSFQMAPPGLSREESNASIQLKA